MPRNEKTLEELTLTIERGNSTRSLEIINTYLESSGKPPINDPFDVCNENTTKALSNAIGGFNSRQPAQFRRRLLDLEILSRRLTDYDTIEDLCRKELTTRVIYVFSDPALDAAILAENRAALFKSEAIKKHFQLLGFNKAADIEGNLTSLTRTYAVLGIPPSNPALRDLLMEKGVFNPSLTVK